MIINAQYNSGQMTAPPALTRVAEELSDLCITSGSSVKLDEVVAGVSAFLASGSTATVKSPTIRRLLARALRSVGERDLASCALVLHSGLLQVRESVVAEDPVYVLDLSRLNVRDSEQLDLILVQSLVKVLETIAWVWQESGGKGVLGIKNVEHLAGSVLGPLAKQRAVRVLGNEIRHLCREKLRHMGLARGWEHVPFVMEMDLK